MNFDFEGSILEAPQNFCNQNWPKAFGYCETKNIVSDSNKLVVDQNNTIIALLVSLHHKVDKISVKEIPKSSDIDKLADQFSKLSTTFEKKFAPKTKFLVYKKNV